MAAESMAGQILGDFKTPTTDDHAATQIIGEGKRRDISGARSLATAPEREYADWKGVLASLPIRYPEPDRVSFSQRIVECSLAVAVLLVTWPILLLVAILVRLDSPGPVLFRHPRVGRGGRLFYFTKFRTLYADAKQRFPDLYAYQYTPDEIERLCFKIPDDPRVTRVGRWLRQSTLDELPNFWHILTGDMSLVGPRPEIPEMLSYYADEDLIKFSVRPGITGLAQISGRGRLRFLETAKFDSEYVRKRCFLTDVRIMVRTIYLILRRDGAF